jgi:hypothetical protein
MYTHKNKICACQEQQHEHACAEVKCCPAGRILLNFVKLRGHILMISSRLYIYIHDLLFSFAVILPPLIDWTAGTRGKTDRAACPRKPCDEPFCCAPTSNFQRYVILCKTQQQAFWNRTNRCGDRMKSYSSVSSRRKDE